MLRFTYVLLILLAFSTSETLLAQEGVTMYSSSYSAIETAHRVEQIISEKGLTLFQRIDHHENAAALNLELQPTTLFIFGNPALGTELMKCKQTVAIDLPMKILVWQSEAGNVQVGFNDPSYLQKRHNMNNCEDVLKSASKALNGIVTEAAGK